MSVSDGEASGSRSETPAGSIAKQRLQDTVSGIVAVHVTVPAKLARNGCAIKLGLAVDD